MQQGPPTERPFGGYATLVITLIAMLLLLVIVLILFFPRLESVKATKPIEAQVEMAGKEKKEGSISPLEVTLRLLNEDEKRVVKALVEAGGSILQKDISYELSLSRVKTHRVLVGLIERGIVFAEKYYNTNKITLADWLKLGDD
jgi:uncharacterized membrane protein